MADNYPKYDTNYRSKGFDNLTDAREDLLAKFDSAVEELQKALYDPEQHRYRQVSGDVDKIIGEINALGMEIKDLEGAVVSIQTHVSSDGREKDFDDLALENYEPVIRKIGEIRQKTNAITAAIQNGAPIGKGRTARVDLDRSNIFPVTIATLENLDKELDSVFDKDGVPTAILGHETGYGIGAKEEYVPSTSESLPGSVQLADMGVNAPSPGRTPYDIADSIGKKGRGTQKQHDRLVAMVLMAENAKRMQEELVKIAERNAAQGSEAVESDPDYIAKKAELVSVLADMRKLSYGKSGKTNLVLRDLVTLNKNDKLSTIDMVNLLASFSQAYRETPAGTAGGNIVNADLRQGNSPFRKTFGIFAAQLRRWLLPGGMAPKSPGVETDDDAVAFGQVADFDEDGNINGTEFSGNLLQRLEQLMGDMGFTVTARKETPEEQAKRQAEEEVKKAQDLEILKAFRQKVLDARRRLEDRKLLANESQEGFLEDKALTYFHPDEKFENDPGSWQGAYNRYTAFNRVRQMRDSGDLKKAFAKWAAKNFEGGFSTLFRDDPDLSDTTKGEMANVIGDDNGDAETFIMKLLAAVMGFIPPDWMTVEHHDAVAGELAEGNDVAEEAAYVYDDIVKEYGAKNLFRKRVPDKKKNHRQVSMSVKKLILEALNRGEQLPYAYIEKGGYDTNGDILNNPKYKDLLVRKISSGMRKRWNAMVTHGQVMDYDLEHAVQSFALPVEDVDTTVPSSGETIEHSIAEEPDLPAFFEEFARAVQKRTIKDSEGQEVDLSNADKRDIREHPTNWARKNLPQAISEIEAQIRVLDETIPAEELRNPETEKGKEKAQLVGRLNSIKELAETYVSQMDAYIAGIQGEIAKKKAEIAKAKEKGIKMRFPQTLYDKLDDAKAKRDAIKDASYTSYTKEGIAYESDLVKELNGVGADDALPKGATSQYAASFFSRINLGLDTRTGMLGDFIGKLLPEEVTQETAEGKTVGNFMNRKIFENEGYTGINNLLQNPSLLEGRLEKFRELARQQFRNDDEKHPHQLNDALAAIDNVQELMDEIVALESKNPKDVTAVDEQLWRDKVGKLREVSKKLNGMFRWGPDWQKYKEDQEEAANLPGIDPQEAAVIAARGNAIDAMVGPGSEAKGAKFVRGAIENAGQTLEDWLNMAQGVAEKNNPEISHALANQERNGEFITGMGGYLGKSREGEEGYYQEVEGQVTETDREALEKVYIAIQKIKSGLRILGNKKREAEWAVASTNIKEAIASLADVKGVPGARSMIRDLIGMRIVPALEKYETEQDAKAREIANNASKVGAFTSPEEAYAAMIAALNSSLKTEAFVSVDRFTDLDLYHRLTEEAPMSSMAEDIKEYESRNLPLNQEVITSPMTRLAMMSYALEDKIDYNDEKYDEYGELASDVDREDNINYLRSVVPGSVSGLADPMEFFQKSRDWLYNKRAYTNIQTVGSSLLMQGNYELARSKVAPENQAKFDELASKLIAMFRVLNALQASPTSRSLHGLSREGIDVLGVSGLIDSPELVSQMIEQFLFLQNLPGAAAPAETGKGGSWGVTNFVKRLDTSHIISGFEKSATAAALSEKPEDWIGTQKNAIIGKLIHANEENVANGRSTMDRDSIVAYFSGKLDEEWNKLKTTYKDKLGDVDRPDISPEVMNEVVTKVLEAEKLNLARRNAGAGGQAELPVSGTFGRSNLNGIIDSLKDGFLIDYKTSPGAGRWLDDNGKLDRELFGSRRNYKAYAFQTDIAQVLLYAAMKGKDVNRAGIEHVYYDENNKAHSEFINFDETLIAFGKGLLDGLFGKDLEGRAQVEEALGNLRPINSDGSFADGGPSASTGAQVGAQAAAQAVAGSPSRGTSGPRPYAKGFSPPYVPPSGGSGGSGGGSGGIPSAGGNFENNVFTNNTFMPPNDFQAPNNLNGVSGGAPSAGYAQMPFSKQGAAYAGVTTILDQMKVIFKDLVGEMRSVNGGRSSSTPFSQEGFDVLASITDKDWKSGNANVNSILSTSNPAPGSALLNNELDALAAKMIASASGGDVKAKAAYRSGQDYLQGIFKSLKSGTFLQLGYALQDPLNDLKSSPETYDFVSAVQAYIVKTLQEDRAANSGKKFNKYISSDVRKGLGDRVNATIGFMNQAVGEQARSQPPFILDSISAPLTQEDRDRMADEAVAKYGAEVRNAGRFNTNYLRTMASVRELTYAGRGIASGIWGYDSKAATRVGEATNVLQTSLYGASSVTDMLRALPQMALTGNKDYLAALSLRREAQVLQQTDIDLLLKKKQQEQDRYDNLITQAGIKVEQEGRKVSWKSTDANGNIIEEYDPSVKKLRLERAVALAPMENELLKKRTQKEQLEAEATLRQSSAEKSVSGLTNFFQTAGTAISIFVTVGMALAQIVQMIKKYNEEQNALTRETKELATQFVALRSGVLAGVQSITTFDQLMAAAKKVDSTWDAKTQEYDDYRKMREAQSLIIFQGSERRIRKTIFDTDQGAQNASTAYRDYQMIAGNTLQAAGQKIFGKSFTVGQNSQSIERAIDKMFTGPVDMSQWKFMRGMQRLELAKSGALKVKDLTLNKEFAGMENSQQLLDIARLGTLFRDGANQQNPESPDIIIQKNQEAQLLLANVTLRDQLVNLKEMNGGVAEMNRKAETSAFTGLLFSAQQNAQKNALQTTGDIDEFYGKNHRTLVVDEAFGNLGSMGEVIQNVIANKALETWDTAKDSGLGAAYFRGNTKASEYFKNNDFVGFLTDELYTYISGAGLLGDSEKNVKDNVAIAKKELLRQQKGNIPTAGMFSYNQWKTYAALAEDNPEMQMTSPSSGKPFTYASYTAAVKAEAEKGLKKDLETYKKDLSTTKAGTTDWYNLVTQINSTRQALADLADASKLVSTWFNIAGAIVRPTKAIVENNIYPDLKVYINDVDVTSQATIQAGAKGSAPKPLRTNGSIVDNFRQAHNLDP